MRHSTGLTSTAEALRLVFLPRYTTSRTTSSKSRLPLQARRCVSSVSNEPLVSWRPAPLSKPTLPHPGFGPRPNRYGPSREEDKYARGPIAPRTFGPRPSVHEDSGPRRDEKIRSKTIRLVDPDNKICPPSFLPDILASIDRKTHFVQQVSPQDDPEVPFPVCKIIDKKENRERKKQLAKAVRTVQAEKKLELSWFIGKHDLEHRMRKVREFVQEGRRVEVVVGATRRKGQAKKAAGIVLEEAAETLKTIKEAIAGIEEATEWKPMIGEVGKLVTLFVERKGKNKGEQKAEKEAE